MKHVLMFVVAIVRVDGHLVCALMVAEAELFGEAFETLLLPVTVGNMTLMGSITSHECPKVNAG